MSVFHLTLCFACPYDDCKREGDAMREEMSFRRTSWRRDSHEEGGSRCREKATRKKKGKKIEKRISITKRIISALVAIIALRVQDALNARYVQRVKHSASGANVRKRQLPRVPNATSEKMPQGVKNIAGTKWKVVAPFAESLSNRRTSIALIAE